MGLTAWCGRPIRHRIVHLHNRLSFRTWSAFAGVAAAIGFDGNRELAEQLKRTDIAALKAEPVSPFETGSSNSQQQPARARRGSNRKASSTASATDATEKTGQVSGLEESKMLKQELKSRGLSVKGSKAELKARLAAAQAADV